MGNGRAECPCEVWIRVVSGSKSWIRDSLLVQRAAVADAQQLERMERMFWEEIGDEEMETEEGDKDSNGQPLARLLAQQAVRVAHLCP